MEHKERPARGFLRSAKTWLRWGDIPWFSLSARFTSMEFLAVQAGQLINSAGVLNTERKKN